MAVIFNVFRSADNYTTCPVSVELNNRNYSTLFIVFVFSIHIEMDRNFNLFGIDKKKTP